MNDKIMGGAFFLARQIFNSQIWQDKPSSWKIIWIYILGQVNHADNGKFRRGEGFFNFKREIKDIGCDITYDMIRHSMAWFKGQAMIGTSRSTRGIIIKVLKYDKYQSLENYQSTSSSTSKAQEKHIRSTPINKNDKNDKNNKNINTLASPVFTSDSLNSTRPIKKEEFLLQEELEPNLHNRNFDQPPKETLQSSPKLSKTLVNTFLQEMRLNRPDGDFLKDNIIPAKQVAKFISEIIIAENVKATDEEILKFFVHFLEKMSDFHRKNATNINYIKYNFNRILNTLK